VAFAAASADVALSGTAEMGIQGGESSSTTGTGIAAFGVAQETQFVQDIDVTFTMSGTSDNGLTFGAAIDLDENAANVGTDGAGVAIFVSGDFGTLTLGDTDGALDWAMQEVALGGAGSIADNETAHAGYDGDYGDQGRYLRYEYSFGDFGVALSVSPDDNWAIGAKYDGAFAGGAFGVGIGYQEQAVNNRFAPGNLGTVFDILGGGDGIDSANISTSAADGDGFRNATGLGGDVEVLGVSAYVTMDMGFSAAIQYAEWEFSPTAGGAFDATHVGIGAAYTFDAITVSGNWGQYNFDIPGVDNVTGFGLAASYDFGGGLSAHIGYGHSDLGNTIGGAFSDDTYSNYSFGLAMSF
jgi:outer membrane protein OmpU